MTPEESGFVYSALLRYRLIETVPSGTRKARLGEVRAAEILADASEEELNSFRLFLEGQGFRLETFTASEMPDIADQAYCVIYVGSKLEDCPPILTPVRVFEDLKRSREFGNTNKEISCWWMFLWLVYLTFLYESRDWREVSKYSSRIIRLDIFQERAASYLSKAQHEISENQGSWFAKELVGSDGNDRISNNGLSRMCKKFLSIQADNRLIVEITPKSQEYRQTLLGAADIARKFQEELRFIFPQSDVLEDAQSALEKDPV
ncbi:MULTISPECIES: hypothetical protein [Thalassospira]|uniref:Uncharacterized protein n=1 Tax=Thalassospira xiamenensis TaxID=220697 RepID=A0A367XAG9_9PROT|nr:hypothetical protein [Thalassospira xiamenensis]RCK50648.1 hypothetical protein TH44_11775 [Thalassospira xiamenensis]BDW91005.1 hypothetical protein MACH01_37720 [Thalassospira tepidiphila]